MGPHQFALFRRGFQCPPCQPRSRQCLYAGCGRWFLPCCARRYYCSPACREAARRWSQDRAQEKYRASEQGKACRREQSRRYRERCRERARCSESAEAEVPKTACEGHQQGPPEPCGKKIYCARPGCYNQFVVCARSPLQRFCSSACRNALRASLTIQRRWQEGCVDCPWRSLADRLPPGDGP